MVRDPDEVLNDGETLPMLRPLSIRFDGDNSDAENMISDYGLSARCTSNCTGDGVRTAMPVGTGLKGPTPCVDIQSATCPSGHPEVSKVWIIFDVPERRGSAAALFLLISFIPFSCPS